MIMSAKPKKPPIDKKSLRAHLVHAQDERLKVVVRRWIPDAERLEGFVVSIGTTWVALQRLSDRIEFDGWHLLRLKDIQAVAMDPDHDCFEFTALKARRLWPPSAPALRLDDSIGAMAATATAAPLVSVFDEFDRPGVCSIGSIVSVDEAKLRLLTVDSRGAWARKPRTFRPADVTRIDIGGGYEDALALVAGPPPAD